MRRTTLAVAVAVLGSLVAAAGAQAFEYGAVNPVTPGTIIPEPSGVTVTMSTTGLTSVTSPADALSARGAVNTNFTPPVDAALTTFRPSVVVAGCGTVTAGATKVCTGLGTMTITFSRPVRNPTIHLAGLGGASQVGGGPIIRFTAAGALTASVPAGATLGPPLAGATNLQTTATDFRVTTDNANNVCSSAVAGGSTAGCGSFVVNGTVTSVTFTMSSRMVVTSGSATPIAGANDVFNLSVSLRQDLGDAPASYDPTQAAAHIISDLQLGAGVDEDQATTANPTASANAVAAGANPNGTAGDGADEDALVSWPALTTASLGSTYTVTVPLSGLSAAARLCGWIDFNRNNVFDNPAERACANPASGATSASLSWTVPTATSAGPLYARLRLGYNATQIDNPTGRADSGEVEDYQLAMLPVVRVNKTLVSGGSDTFNLAINGTTLATAVGNGGTTGPRTVYHNSTFTAPDLTVAQNVAAAAVPITIAETATAGNTNLYTSSYTCVNATGATVATGTATSGSVSIPQSTTNNAQAQNITCTFTNTPIPPSITVDKVAGPIVDNDGNGADAGDTVTYTFTVRNSGGVPLTGVAISDPKLAGATPAVSVSCTPTTLAPNATANCTSSGPYTITQADVDSGAVNNVATASGTPPTGPAVTGTDPNVVTIPATPRLTIDKSASAVNDLDGNGPDTGDTIIYTFAVSNTGNVTVNPATVSDPLLGGILPCSAGSLAPGASLTCGPFTYTITAADFAAQVRNNTATATGTPARGTLTPATDSTSTPIVPVPRIAIDKVAGAIVDVDGNGPDAGDRISYTFTVTNTGTTTLTGVAVSDPKLAGATPPVTVTCTSTTLAAGASTPCTASGPYTISAADVTAGAVNNTATATGTPPTGPAVTGTDTTTTPVTPVPGISLDKQASTVTDGDGNGPDPGDTITYTFVVTNTGGTSLTNVSVADPLLAGATPPITINCPAGALASGATRTCTASAPYALTSANVDAGTVTNTATATGTPPTGPNVTANDSTTTTVPRTATIALDKTAGAITDLDANGPDAGDTVTYGFVVTNTGNVTLTGIVLRDPPVTGTPITCPATTLAAGASMTCSPVTATLTQAEVDAGSRSNTARVQGTPPAGVAGPVSADDTVTVPINPTSSVAVDKSAGAIVDLDANGPDAGDTITYTFVVTNTGNVTLNPVALNDPKLGGAMSCPATTLAGGASMTCTAVTYTLTQADIDAGAVNNTATVTGTPPTGPAVTGTDSTSTPIGGAPAITLDKSADPIVDVDANGPDAGDTITYRFVVTNSGNVTLNPVSVSDSLVGPVTCPAGPLAPAATRTCTPVTYTLTQADIDAGTRANTATATGTPPTGPPVTGTDTVTTPIPASPAITLDKAAGAITDTDANGPDAGDTITYTFTVTNTGNTTLNPVAVSDPLLGAITCPATTLAGGASMTCTPVTYTLTQADIDAGTRANTATATGTPPTGPPVTDDDTTTTPITRTATITLDKTAGAITDTDLNGPDAGDTITYTFLVTNTGNTTLTGIELRDPPVTGTPITCPATTLAPGASMTCDTVTATLTQAEVDAEQRANTARVEGTPPAGMAGPVIANDTVTVPIAPTRSIAVDKSAGAIVDLDANGPDAGDTITYTFVVTNTGNVTLNPVALNDPKLGGAMSCPATTLAGGASMTCTAVTYTLLQSDVDTGAVNNTATATGTPPTGPPVTGTDSTSTPIAGTPAITLDKAAGAITDTDANGPDAGDTITYTFTVTNTGNTTLNPVAVSDPLLGAITCPATTLAGGASMTCTPVTYTLTQADIDAGTRANTATATGTPPTGPPVTDDDTTTTPITRTATITLDKTAGAITDTDLNGPDAGDTITYSFLVTNTGNVTLNPVTVTDPLLGAIGCAAASLAPGATTSCTAAPYVLTQADVDAGAVNNTATATGTPPTGPPVTGTDATSTPITAGPNLAIDKTADPIVDTDANGVDAGDTITYRFVVTNTGNVTLTQIAVSDSLVALTCPRTSLAPSATMTCTATAPYVVTQADMDTGQRVNTATVTAQPPAGPPLSRQDTVTVPLSQRVDLVLDKVASPITDLDANGQDAGDRITYTFKVTNNGNVTMSAIALTDPTLGGAITCPQTTLAPGASMDCTTTTYNLTQADVDAGQVVNTARVDADAPPSAGGPTFATDTTATPVSPAPAIALDKSAGALNDVDGNGQDAGDTITYSFAVSNIGNVTLTSVGVSDPKAGTVTCTPTSLAPGATATCTGSPYAITQADVDAGTAVNTATASGTPPSGPAVTATDNTSTPITPLPALALDKSVAAIDDLDSNGRDAGDTITYAFTVTNTGNVTLTAVGVSDSQVGTVTCAATTLAVGASTSCTAAPHVLTQPEVDAGTTSNTATATGTPPSGPAVTATDSTTTPIPPGPAAAVDKTAGALNDVDGNGPDAGDTITYGFTVLNTGTVTLTATTVTDPLLGAITCPAGPVAPGGSITCNPVTYTLTQADVDAGVRDNTSSVDATPPLPAPVAQRSDSTSTVIPRVANVTIDKIAGALADVDGNGQDAGDTITYDFKIANTGNVTLSNVAVTDPLFGPLTCPATLAPGATANCTAATLTLTQAQVDAGVVNNTATVVADTPMGTQVTANDSTTTPIGAAPLLVIDKTASAVNDIDGNGVDAGDTIVYGFVVSNGGNVTLSAIDVTDNTVGAITCPATTLAPGASMTCTSVTHTITQTEMNSGTRRNTATANAETPAHASVTATDTVDTPLTRTPAITLDKVAGPLVDTDGNGNDAGDEVTFTFRVTNTGNISLLGVALSDPRTGPLTCPAATLEPGEFMDCSPATVAVTVADMNAGALRNTATVTADTPYGATVFSNDSTLTPLGGVAAVTIDKSAGPIIDTDGNGADAGDTITYGFVVTNTGTVSLDGLAVNDPLVGGAVTCPQASLDPGEAMTCTAKVLTLTQAIVDGGSANNTATVTGTGGNGTPATAQDSTATPIPGTPAIDLQLAAGPVQDLDGNGIDAGDAITYSYVVTNTGNVTLTQVTVTDPVFGTFTCPVGSLAPGQSIACVPPGGGRALLTAADIKAGRRVEQATASGVAPNGQVVTDPATVTTPIQLAALTLTKTASRTTVRAGGTLTFTLTARNTGQAAARRITLCDVLPRGMSVVKAGGGKLRAGKLCWTITLNPGGRVIKRIVVRVDKARKPGRLINRATLSTGQVALTAQRPIAVLPAVAAGIPIVTG